MKIKFYQSHWFNIDLQEIANCCGHSSNKVADQKFYEIVYEHLLYNNFNSISQNWINKKNTLSNYLVEFFENNQLKDSKILSVGCGFGIVEQPLIQANFKIDLQECQEISIKYMQSNFLEDFKKVHFINSLDLKEINDHNYNVAMAITSTYCLTDQILKKFLESIYRIINKNGFFIWYETALSLNDVLNFLKMKIRNVKPHGVLWGWKRSINTLIKEASKVGLNLVSSCYFDENNKIIYPKKIMSLPVGKNIAWQMMVFKKND